MSASIATVHDDFELTTPASLWAPVANGSATYAQTAGQARFTLPSSAAGTHTARYTSRVAYDVSGAFLYINIGTMVSTSVAATAFFQLYKDGSNTLQWIQVSGTLYARTIIGGVSTDRYTVAWNAATYKYLRIRESGGFIFWDSSVNGVTWTQRATLANPFAVTDLFIDFGATGGNLASPGSFRLDDVNLILPALTTTWRWIQVVWPFDERTETITTATAAANSIQGYVVTADGVDASDNPSGNIRYWSGPMDAGRVLTEQLAQAAAQAMAVNFPLDGRVDLAEMVEGHCYRVYFRSMTGAAVTWRELYPRRTNYADDMKAESITALHLAADIITAREIGTVNLDATARITAGGGVLSLDDRGATLIAPSSYLSNAAIRWVNSVGATLGELYQLELANSTRQMVLASRVGSAPATITLLAEGSGQTAQLFMAGTATGSTVTVVATLGTTFQAGPVTVQQGLNLGTASTAGAGQLAMSSVAAINGAPISGNVGLNAKGSGTTNATAAIQGLNSAGLVDFRANDDGTIQTRTGNRYDLQGVIIGTPGAATKRVRMVVDGQVCNLLSN